MSSISQFISPAIGPIGSVIHVAESVPDDLITLGSAEYLKSGKAVAYDTKYDTAVSRGLGINRWGTVPNPLMGNYSDSQQIKTYAKGSVGRLYCTNRSVSYGLDYNYIFTGRNGNGLNNQVNIQYPVSDVANTGYFIDRTDPVYLSASDVWVFFESYNIRVTSTGYNLVENYYVSKDGSNWEKHNYRVATVGTAFPQVSIALVATASSVYAALRDTSGATSNLTHLVRINIDANGNIGNIVPSFYTLTNVTRSGTIGPNDAYLHITTSGPNYSVLLLNDTGVAQYIVAGSNTHVFWDRSTSGRLCLTLPDNSAGYYTYSGTNVSNLVTSGVSLALHNSPNNTWLEFTGTYFVHRYLSNTTPTTRWSADGNTWTNLGTAQSNNIAFSDGGVVFKNHVLFNTGSTYSLAIMPTNTVSGTVAPNTYTLSYQNSCIDMVVFNSKQLALTAQAILDVPSNMEYADLVWWNSSNQSPISIYSRFKVVNNRLFVLCPTTNNMLTSTDGALWTTLTVTGLSKVYDIEYNNSKWIVSGYHGTTTNNYNSTDLVSWVAGPTVAAASNFVTGLLNTGTSVIAISNNGVRRTVDGGVTWSTIATLTSVPYAESASYYTNGSTSHIFFSTAVTGYVIKYTSTDNGATWTATNTNLGVYVNDGASFVPHNIQAVGGKYYCILGKNTSSYIETNSIGIYSSSDLVTFNPITIVGEFTPPSISTYYPGSIYQSLSGMTMFTSGEQSVVLGGSAGGFIGVPEIISGNGYNGYVRIA